MSPDLNKTARLAMRATAAACCAAAACAAAAADADPGQLDEIVVTAQKTSENLNKVPISMSVLTGQNLADEGIKGYEDLARAVPNVSFTNFGGPGQSNIEIRGISSQAGSATTGIYLDDVPINIINIYTAGATEPKFFDIDRVEVLRGPQGTIYGSSSMGGTLHFVSVKPDLHGFSGTAEAEAGATKGGGLNYKATGVLNLPLSDGVAALRLGVMQSHDSGWIDRIDAAGNVVARKINDANATVLRATLLWQPSSTVTITPSLFLQRVANGGNSLFGVDYPQFQSPTLVAETSTDEYGIASVTVGYDLGDAELTSVSGFFWRQDHRLIDGTFYDSAYIGYLLDTPVSQGGFGLGNGATIAQLPAPSKFNTAVNQVHQEWRLASKPAGPADRWSWIGGLYFSRNRTDLLDDEHIPGFNTTFQSVYGATPESLLGAGLPNDLVYYANSVFINEEKAVFGQVGYKLMPALTATAGLRYEKASESLAFDSAGFLSAGTPPADQSVGAGATTPRFALTWEATAQTLVYASAAKGYRVGGANRPMPAALCGTPGPAGYDPDSLWSYELGTKTRALGDLISLSAALFDIRWTNMQQDVIVSSCGFDYKTNTGDAESKGAEFELRAHLTDRFSLGLGGNSTSAKMTTSIDSIGVLKGDHVPGVPDWSMNVNMEYGAPVNGGRAYGRVNAQWTGTSQGVILHGDPDFYRPGYFLMGGGLGYDRDRTNVSLFVTNLLNQHKILQRPNVALVEYGVSPQPRTIGIRASYDF
jgi:outer membrane receptor protein involved in Fe transport